MFSFTHTFVEQKLETLVTLDNPSTVPSPKLVAYLNRSSTTDNSCRPCTRNQAKTNDEFTGCSQEVCEEPQAIPRDAKGNQ